MARFISFYLPQYHPTPENNVWWGKGFTEWTNVAKAKSLFRGHIQPNIPEELGFYDLRYPEIRERQAELARNAGLEGFCYFHFWFGNGKRILETPFNEVLKSKKPDFPFCLSWSNHSWEKKQFDKEGNSEMLLEQLYPGESDYVDHFNEMLPAFEDSRYIKINDKLVFFIYDPLSSDQISLFIKTWRKLAKDHDLNDFYFIARDANNRSRNACLKIGFDATYNDDVFNIHHNLNIVSKIILWIKRNWMKRPTVFKYKKAINYMVTDHCKESNVFPVIAPNWDHSPRSGGNAIILHDSKPKYFKSVVNKSLEIVKDKPEEEKIIIIKSWNEWGEGNYMEPDIIHGSKYLDALREVIDRNEK